MIIMANSATDCHDTEVDVLQNLAHGLWRVIIRKRLHNKISADVK